MSNLGRIGLGLLFTLILPISAPAQMGTRSGAPSIHGVWNPVVGQGGVYEFSTKDGSKQTMEMAIVGKETVEGKDAYWYEITMNSPEAGGQMVMKHLFVAGGGDLHTTRMIMQFPGKPPMEMSSQMLQYQHSKQSTDIKTEATDAGSETITVPAGTFSCEHYRMNDGTGDAWVAKNVTPYGLVKYTGKDTSMVLVKVITDAKDKITGKPIPFNPEAFAQ